MRRKDRQITQRDEIDTIINACQVCRLALARDNQPYIVPVCFGYDGGAVYLHTARKGKKIDFFLANDRVCFEFEGDVRLKKDEEKACKWSLFYESVVGEGTISELTEPKEMQYGLNRIMKQYSGKSWRFDAESMAGLRVWKITIASINGKRSA